MAKDEKIFNVKWASIVSILLLLLTVVFTGNAKADSRVSGNRTTLDVVNVIGPRGGDRLTGSGRYIGSDELGRHGYDDINEILRGVPGVYLREEDGYGLFPNISLRGVDPGRSGKVTLMEDGILTAPAPYSAPSAYYSPTAGRMHGIEVLKGSSQIKYGPHTTGGVVNYLSTPIPTGPAFYVKSMGGTDFQTDGEVRIHTYAGNTFDTAWGNVGLLGEVYFRGTDGFKVIDPAGPNDSNDDTGFTLFEPMIKASWEPETDRYQRIEMKAGFTHSQANESYLGLNDGDFRNDPFRRYAASRYDNIYRYHIRTYLRYLVELADRTQLTSTGYFNYFYRNWFKLNDRIDPAGGGTADRLGISQALESAPHLAVLKGMAAGSFRYRANQRKYYAAGIQQAVNHSFDLGPTQHNVELGWRYHQDHVRRFQHDTTFTQDAGGVITGRVESGPGTGGNRRQTSQATAVYVEDEISWKNVTVKPGIRFEHVNGSFKDLAAGTSGEGDVDIFAPGVGLHLRVNEAVSLFGGYHRGISTPGPQAHAASGLGEETSDAFELGVRTNHGGWFAAETVFFFTHFSDLIVTDNIGGAGSGMDENAGDVNARGIEFSAEIDPAKAAGKKIKTPIRTALTWTHARLDGDAKSTDPESIFAGGADGNKVPYVPEIQMLLGAGVEGERWGVNLDAVFVDETFATADNVTTLFNAAAGERDARFGTTDRYWSLDLSAFFDATEYMRIFVNLQNITDGEVLVSRHPHGGRPAKPFSATAGVELTWG